MKLINGILRPGKVVSVLDNGKVTASAPGLFSAEDKDKLPPILPFFPNHSNAFIQPKKDEEVWVANFSDNPQQLYWIYKDNIENLDDADIDTGDGNLEVICARNTGSSWATLYFSDGSGWMISANGSKMNIDKNGNVYIGKSGGPYQPAVLGDDLKNVLTDIVTLIGKACALIPYPGAATDIPAILGKLEMIKSNTVNISK